MKQIVEFILELDRLKGITRKTKPVGLERYENSAEHSWQIALLAASMAQYAHAPVNIERVVPMLLVHDIGEIETGDTMFYTEAGLAERKAAEKVAVTRIFSLLGEPQCSTFMSLWQEFDDNETPEARFAHAADRAMPVILNLANNGQSWRENGITYERVVSRVGPPIKAGCPALWEYLEVRLEEERQNGWFAR
jgi:putative hydrolases of HD superfamily